MPSVYIKTYGCQMNERDSEQVAAQLIAKGYILVDSEAAAHAGLVASLEDQLHRASAKPPHRLKLVARHIALQP